MKASWCCRMRGWLIIGLIVGSAPSGLFAAEQTFEAQVVDPATYLKDGKIGPELDDQTYEAVDGGQTLALLDPTSQNLYLLLADKPGEDPNELVYDHVNRRVKVTGTIYERGGIRGIVVTSVQPSGVSEKPAAAVAPNEAEASNARTDSPNEP